MKNEASKTLGAIETRRGPLLVEQKEDGIYISVDGVVRHPRLNWEGAIGALCHYLHSAEYSLIKLAKQAEESKQESKDGQPSPSI